MIQHFLRDDDLTPAQQGEVLALAAAMKKDRFGYRPLEGPRAVPVLFDKPSLRTRVSFQVGIQRLGGTSVALAEGDVQIGVREPVADAARVLERYVDLIVARLRRHADLVELAHSASVPVINALTELEHPCQVLADLLTISERCGSLEVPVAFVGDGNNMVTSLAHAQALLGFPFTVVTPPGYEPSETVRRFAPKMQVSNYLAAVAGAKVLYTDVWTSMGFEDETQQRRADFAGYRVDAALMDRAPGAVFLHCLPAHRGEEVTDEVIDGPSSAVFDQAENRLHAQMALMSLLI